MLLQFPNQQTLTLAITSGTIPADAVIRTVVDAFHHDGRISVSSGESVPKDSSVKLMAWGVIAWRSRKRFKLNF